MTFELWQVMLLAMVCVVVIVLAGIYLFLRFFQQIRSSLARETENSLATLLIFLPVTQFWTLVGGFTLLVCTLVLVISQQWQWVLACFVLCIAALPWLRVVARNRRVTLIERQLPEALRLLATSLQAGLSLMPALILTAQQVRAPLATELKLVAQRQQTGDSLTAALNDFYQRADTALVQFFTFALITSARYGGQQAEMLNRMARAIQQQHYAQERILSLSAQARLQGKIMFVLPLFLYVAIRAVSTESSQLLTQTDAGKLVLVVCACMMAVGFFLTRRILGQFRRDA
ncbi:type II secretion system F family protein [Pseudidiomarina insulisalsae]|uniref:Type II secretion system protein GspF domain-containing protein n=1 Tax=Pseudidiomarina insulisalsae TaxID=575789 RepID=A0A432Y8N2_9GAMM|nr:type II secretion system F family protein [Pseudidiomarina insulisalsae]RUO57339.1 hypothetical protein CWI71_11840 [Pseudidiomarina insulisalsae]